MTHPILTTVKTATYLSFLMGAFLILAGAPTLSAREFLFNPIPLPGPLPEPQPIPEPDSPTTISVIPDQVVGANGDTGIVYFTVSDPDIESFKLHVSATSSDTSIVPNQNITISPFGPSHSIRVIRQGSSSSDVTITVTAYEKIDKPTYRTFKVSQRIESNTPNYAQTGSANIADQFVGVPLLPVSDAVGSVKAEAGVSGGAAVYNIPITLPPGRANMQPSVSVNYSSKAGNGILGVGWSLSAASAISRCAATYEQDGYALSVQYSQQKDRLCFNGQRLIVTNGATYGSHGAVYHTEMDSFAKVTQTGDINDYNASFKVEYKNGLTSYFGTDTNSRVKPVGAPATLTWQIQRSHDATNNNYIHYVYQKYGSGEHLIKDIYYTGNSASSLGDRRVSFSYSDRADQSFSYLKGGKAEFTQRLTHIKTYVNTNSLVKEYRFDNSTLSRATNRTLLSSLQECGPSRCLPKTSFTWKDAPHTYVLEEVGYVEAGSIVPIYPFTDYNRHDFVFENLIPNADHDGNGTRDWQDFSMTPEGQLDEVLNTEQSFCNFNIVSNQYDCVFADFNIDGATDPIRLRQVSSANPTGAFLVDIKLNNNWVYNVLPVTFGQAKYEGIKNIADINGDGWPDIYLTRVYNSQLLFEVYFNTKNTQAPYSVTHRYEVGRRSTNTVESASVRTPSYVLAGDLDGNGLPDFILSRTFVTGTSFNEAAFLSDVDTQGNYSLTSASSYSFPPPPTAVFGGNDMHFYQALIDINSDGLADLVTWEDGATNRHTLNYQLNLGNGTFSSTKHWLGADSYLAAKSYVTSFKINSEENAVQYEPKYPTNFMDVDGDGKAELLVPAERVVVGCTYVNENSGFSFNVVKRCGDAIYKDFKHSDVNSNETMLVDPRKFDDSVYRFDAIKWELNSQGVYQAKRVPTQIHGTVGEVASLDATGDGLQDMVFAFGPRRSVYGASEGKHNSVDTSTSFGSRYGLWINRNKGSADSNERYAATDLMKSATDGLNVRSEWNFLPLSSSQGGTSEHALYEPDFSYMGDGYFHFTSSMNVVSNYKVSDGVGGLSETQYAYKAAVYHAFGRGFQGFRSIIVDQPSGIRAISHFHQKFPLAGSIESIETCLIEDTGSGCSTPLSTTKTYYKEVKTTNHDTWWVFPTLTIKQEFDLANRSDQLSSSKSYVGLTDPGDGTTTPSVSSSAYDLYGNIKESVSIVDNGYSQVKVTQQTTFEPQYEQYGKPSKTTKTFETLSNHSTVYNAQLDGKKQIETTYDWTAALKPSEVNVTPNIGGGKAVSTRTLYNNYGLPTSVTLSSPGEEPRTTRTEYTSDGYFVDKVINAKGHEAQASTSAKHGQALWTKDANNILMTNSYDELGRLQSVTPQSGLGQTAYTYIYWCDGGCDGVYNSNIRYKVISLQAGAPQSIQYKDQFNRTLVTSTQGFTGDKIYQMVDYDALGRKTFESILSDNTAETKGTSYASYDPIGRLLEKKTDTTSIENMQVKYSYNRSETKIEVTPSRGIPITMYRYYSGNGQLIKTTDANGSHTSYAYDAMGNPIVLQDANNVAITASYNALGQKLSVNDPNMGVKTFSYTGYGEVEQEIDANNAAYHYDYDTLGRLVKREINGSPDAEFLFDQSAQGNSGICYGMPSAEIKGTGSHYKRTYYYDYLCRPVATNTKIDSAEYTTSQQYDQNTGRVKAVTYPNQLTVENRYNNLGYLSKVLNPVSGYVYQEVTATNFKGQLTEVAKANGVIEETFDYDLVSGAMLKVTAVSRLATSSQRHRIVYQYNDGYGNLTQQNVEVFNGSRYIAAQENYIYDKLHRLITSKRVSDGVNLGDINYRYDSVGNFTYKSDYVAGYGYLYGNASKSAGGKAGPNAVRQITNLNGQVVQYQYDNNGNMISGDGRTINYNAFNKPTSIKKNGITSEFSYGANHMRYKQVKKGLPTGTEITHYIDKTYEVIERSGVTQLKAYVGDAIITQTVGGNNAGYDIGFVHRDRLGSVVTITDENGNVIDNKSYDPFGKPRKGTFEVSSSPTLKDISSQSGYIAASDDILLTTRRGFTDHEHLDDAQLIHMNGRVYDYNLGRFLSVDPFIQEPGNSQSMNPYSYIMNNPLAGTDPSGYSGEAVQTEVVVYKQNPGSRLKIKSTVTVTGTDNGNGGATITVSAKNGADVSGVAAKLAKEANKAGASVSISAIGSQEDIAKKGGSADVASGSGGTKSEEAPSPSQGTKVKDNPLIKKDDNVQTASLPYLKAEYPGTPGPQPTYVDPESLTVTESEWGPTDTADTAVWGAFKAAVLFRVGKTFGLSDQLSGGVGSTLSGATMENLSVQMKTFTYTATAYDWNGDVYFSIFGGIKAVDYKGLSNPRSLLLEVRATYRVMAGDKEVFSTTVPERRTVIQVSDFIKASGGYPLHDYHN
ncbi:SpvB/TcaC N-terminal domain-containing protein [Aliikangiella sp. IMCC44632]